MQVFFCKIRYLERELSKSLKKLSLIFLLNPALFHVQDYEKQKGPGTGDQLLFGLQNMFRKISLLKMITCPSSTINYFTLICPF